MADLGHGHVRPRPDGAKARCGGPGICPQCSREAAEVGFHGQTLPADEPTVTCPSCGHTFIPVAMVRVTETGG